MKIENLAVLSGDKTTVKNGIIKYEPSFEIKDSKESTNAPITAEVRSDVFFSQGILKFKFKAESPETGILLFSDSHGGYLSIGLSFSSKAFIISDKRNDPKVKTGSLSNFENGVPIEIRIELLGSKCKLFVNNVLYGEEDIILNKSIPVHLRITSNGNVEVYDVELKSIRPKLFVVMQFTEEYNRLYDEVINPIAEQLGFDCMRADEFYTSTPILKDIIASIEESIAIIAEITPDNPNVFYEIGYSHAIKKPTILLCDKKREKLPFDISGFRTLFYENTIAGKSKIEKSLRKYLESIK